jgi:hypothetical protein
MNCRLRVPSLSIFWQIIQRPEAIIESVDGRSFSQLALFQTQRCPIDELHHVVVGHEKNFTEALKTTSRFLPDTTG